MNSIKIIFFDIDGTLIDMRTKRISEKMLETLIRLKENGIILCIATGRSPISLQLYLEAAVWPEPLPNRQASCETRSGLQYHRTGSNRLHSIFCSA